MLTLNISYNLVTGVNTLHREKEKFIESPGEKDRKVVESPSEKGQGNIVNPGQRTGLILLYVC